LGNLPAWLKELIVEGLCICIVLIVVGIIMCICFNCLIKALSRTIDCTWLAQKQERGIVESWLDERGLSLVPLSNPGFVPEIDLESSECRTLLRKQSGEHGMLAQGECRIAISCLLAASCLIVTSA